jgi:hypothetical protein
LKKTAAVLLLASTILFQATADDVEELLEFISDKDLSVHIELSLLDKDHEISWDAESTHITVVGRSVNLRLVADELVIDAYITPFGELGKNLVLVANGEIWFSDIESGNGIRYETFIKSLPIDAGEKVIFFPLGVAVDSETNIYTIQVEISVQPHKEYRKRAE